MYEYEGHIYCINCLDPELLADASPIQTQEVCCICGRNLGEENDK